MNPSKEELEYMYKEILCNNEEDENESFDKTDN